MSSIQLVAFEINCVYKNKETDADTDFRLSGLAKTLMQFYDF